MEEEVPVPVYFAIEDSNLTSIYAEVQQSADATSGSTAMAGNHYYLPLFDILPQALTCLAILSFPPSFCYDCVSTDLILMFMLYKLFVILYSYS